MKMSLKRMVFGGIFVMIFISSYVQSEVYPTSGWLWATPEEVGMDAAKLKQARDYALTGGGSGCIIRGGRMVMAWGNQTKGYDLKSTTKSIGVTALGLAIKDGKMCLSDKAKQHHSNLGVPSESNSDTGWIDEITILHLATQTAGFDKPGGYTELLFAPGTRWAYTDGGTNWLAECITLVYQQDLNTLMFNRIFTPLGIEPKDLTWRNNAYREDTINGIKRLEFGAGIHANVNAMARIGYLYLRGGQWDGQEIIPQSFVDAVGAPVSDVIGLPVVNDSKNRFAGASNHYGLLWWNNADGTLANVPRDAYWSWGLHDSFIIVIPSLDIVVARAGSDWQGQRSPHSYNILKPFLEPIANSVSAGAPYPPSPVITSLTWEPAKTIIRKAEGSDNWPITWADDGNLYTAYGDGWGFNSSHNREKKLSLGISKIAGVPPQFSGVNILAPSVESKGDGRSGRKASGILMVDGVLYLWARNANLRGEQSQLAWSEDHGRTWVWSDWKFEELGYPCFLNFEKNYANARDEYVYVYSPNTPDAYEETDEIILARVHKNKLTNRKAYQFFERLEQSGPVWTKEISQRGAVFSFPRSCNRIDATYNAPLGRYLMTVRSRAQNGGRNQFSIYDAPEPWGPWTTVYYTEQWKGEPLSASNGGWGESLHIPSKWISADGKTFYLVFSGDDAFAVRKATLTVARETTKNNKNLGHIGNFAKWGKIEVAFTGPDSKGRGDPNPFSILLDVVFTSPGGQTFQVPGFYDGDGKSALDGNCWKVRFSADEAGTRNTTRTIVSLRHYHTYSNLKRLTHIIIPSASTTSTVRMINTSTLHR